MQKLKLIIIIYRVRENRDVKVFASYEQSVRSNNDHYTDSHFSFESKINLAYVSPLNTLKSIRLVSAPEIY